jgi:hypothetical protein
MEFSATLSEREWDIVGAGLLELPGKICNPVINKINAQLSGQQGDKDGGSDGRGPNQPAGADPVRPGSEG